MVQILTDEIDVLQIFRFANKKQDTEHIVQI